MLLQTWFECFPNDALHNAGHNKIMDNKMCLCNIMPQQQYYLLDSLDDPDLEPMTLVRCVLLKVTFMSNMRIET